jgi:hypothetical protein
MCKKLEKKAEFYGASIVDYDFPPAIRGAYHNGIIGINKSIVDNAERRCTIAFQLGRHLMRKNKCIAFSEEQENVMAMHWAVSVLMPISAFVEGKKLSLKNAEEFADYLRITPQFLKSGVEFYKNTMGSRILYQDCVIDLENRRIESLKEVG